MRSRVKPILLGFAGVFLAVVVLHLWQDHHTFHLLVGLENQRQAAAVKVP